MTNEQQAPDLPRLPPDPLARVRGAGRSTGAGRARLPPAGGAPPVPPGGRPGHLHGPARLRWAALSLVRAAREAAPAAVLAVGAVAVVVLLLLLRVPGHRAGRARSPEAEVADAGEASGAP